MKKNKVFYGWFIVAGCLLLNAIGTGIFSSIFGLFFPPMAEELGYSQATLGGIIGVAIFAGLLAIGMFSKLYQKYSARKLVLFFGILNGGAYMLMSQTNSLTTMYVVGALIGIFGMGGTALSSPMLITRWFEKKRGTAMGIAVAGAGLGPAVMSPIVTSIIQNSGFRIGFIALGSIVMVSMITAFLLIRDTPEEKGLKAYGLNEGESLDEDDKKTNKSGETYSFTLKEAVKTKMFYSFALFILIMCSVVQGVLIQLPSYLSNTGLTLVEIGKIIAGYALLAGFGKMIIGWVYDNLGVFKGNFVFFTFMILAFLSLLMLPGNSSLIYAYIIFAGIGMGLTPVAVPLLVSVLFGTRNYAALYPIFMLLMSVGAIAGGAIAGGIIDSSGYAALFTTATIGAFLAFLTIQSTMLIAKKTHKKLLVEKKIA